MRRVDDAVSSEAVAGEAREIPANKAHPLSWPPCDRSAGSVARNASSLSRRRALKSGYAIRHPYPGCVRDLGTYPVVMTTAQTELLQITTEHLRQMVREVRLSAHRFQAAASLRFLRAEVMAWVLEQPGYDRSPRNQIE